MTVLASVEPALKRLFERLDSAPCPASHALQLLLGEWSARRAGRIAPTLGDVGELLRTDLRKIAFVFLSKPGGRDYTVYAGTSALEPLLGAVAPGSPLSEATHKREAARLRRILEVVHQSSEPLLADFYTHGSDGNELAVELLVLPIADEAGGEVALLCGFVARPVAAGLPQTSRFHGRPDPMPLVLAFAWDAAFASRVAAELGTALTPVEERAFEDGEHKARPLVDVRGRDTVLIAALHGSGEASVNDKLCRLLFFVETLKANGARTVTVAVPYLAYMRKDRQTKPHDPVTSRAVGRLFEAVGTDTLIALEVHNPAAFQNAFRLPTVHLSASSLFVHHLAGLFGDDPVAVVSPDLGGAKRAELFREELQVVLKRQVARGFMDKQRSMGVVSGDLFAGDVADRHVVLVDDLIASGTTMARVAAACRERGARSVSLVATHGLFSEGSSDALAGGHITRIVVSDSVSPPALQGAGRERLEVVSVAPLFAEAIRNGWPHVQAAW